MSELHLSRGEWETVYHALDEYVTEIKDVYNEAEGHELVEQVYDIMKRIRDATL